MNLSKKAKSRPIQRYKFKKMKRLRSSYNWKKSNNLPVSYCCNTISTNRISNEPKYRIDNLFSDDRLSVLAIASDRENEIHESQLWHKPGGTIFDSNLAQRSRKNSTSSTETKTTSCSRRKRMTYSTTKKQRRIPMRKMSWKMDLRMAMKKSRWTTICNNIQNCYWLWTQQLSEDSRCSSGYSQITHPIQELLIAQLLVHQAREVQEAYFQKTVHVITLTKRAHEMVQKNPTSRINESTSMETQPQQDPRTLQTTRYSSTNQPTAQATLGQ